MESIEQSSGHEQSIALGTNSSQASTQVLHSQGSTTQRSNSQASSHRHRKIDIDEKKAVTLPTPNTYAESVRTYDDQTFEVDGLKYTKPGPAWTETTNVPREHLGFIQVVAFMINQSVGTGIFSTPGAVLLLTKSKVVSIMLWVVGGIYSMLSACVFLEYSTALPYNGGPLIYLDEVFPKPKMLAAVVFSWYYILLCSNDTNAVNTAVYTLQLYYSDAPSSQIDPYLAQFIGIVFCTIACLLLYFLLRQCLLMNSIFAGFKVMVLIVFFVAGIVHASKHKSGLADFTSKYEKVSAIDQIAAMTYVLWAYEGWENTNYIAGEIRSSKQTLKRASFTALGLLTVLYSLLTVAYYAVLPYDDLVGSEWDISLLFARKVFTDGKATKVAVMLSSLTNLVINTYTTTKVQQAIAWQRIIPFSDFFGRQDRQFNSPGGALVLHWIFTTIHILARSPDGDSFRFTSGLFVYGFEMMLIFLGVGIFLLPRRMKEIDSSWKPSFTKSIFSKILIVGVAVAMSMLLLYSLATPALQGTIPRYWWPATLGAIAAVAVLYWAGILILQKTYGSEDNLESIGHRIGFEIFVNEPGDDVPDELVILMREAIADGGKRRLTCKLSGRLAKLTKSIQDGWKIIMRYLG